MESNRIVPTTTTATTIRVDVLIDFPPHAMYDHNGRGLGRGGRPLAGPYACPSGGGLKSAVARRLCTSAAGALGAYKATSGSSGCTQAMPRSRRTITTLVPRGSGVPSTER